MAELTVRVENRLTALHALLNQPRSTQDAVKLAFYHVRKILALRTHTIAVLIIWFHHYHLGRSNYERACSANML